ncbi:hypothetical protein [Streptomyces sp. SID10815]|uniref:hypothetical protein n=1 Tax=Streptomyces sp. SID10815 TaxID=2706027 RepID=UPI0013C76097|nr:hypothetical protein [Streptomyces sp. SID10815]NEA52367.1 hypothetical protein [Streptomyces sp. SID10815]
MTELSVEDIAELRKQGDFRAYLRQITGRSAEDTIPKSAHLTAVPAPAYRIAHTGAWPIGTAATGPTPPPGACTCPQHQQPTTTTHQEGAA